MPAYKDDLMTVGELARRVGVTVRTIQYYDQKGLLHPSSKSEQNQRLYSTDDEERLYRILTLKFLGFSLAQIKEAEGIDDCQKLSGALDHSIFFLIPVGRGKYIEETSLKVLENEALLQDIMHKAADVDIDVKPTCAPQFTRVADQLGIPTRYTRGCLAGLTYCVIGSEGIVRPCAYMTEDAGDVREQPFDEIWATSPVFERLRTQAYGGNCGECEHKKHCGGCRARAAYYHDGDYMAQDDYCAYGQKLGCMGV